MCRVESHLHCFLAVCSGLGCLMSLGLISPLNCTDFLSGLIPFKFMDTQGPCIGYLHTSLKYLS